MGNIYQYRDFYSEELIGPNIQRDKQSICSLIELVLVDLVHKISLEILHLTFFAFIDEKWDMFVSEYMRKH